jgi:predicted transcriptional regulator
MRMSFKSLPNILVMPRPEPDSTYLRATLKPVREQTNVTLSLPETLLRRFRVFAAERNQSMSSLMASAISDMIERESQTQRAKRRFLERIRNAPDRGTKGRIQWTRAELHER